jgi:dienelactone hydrolase
VKRKLLRLRVWKEGVGAWLVATVTILLASWSSATVAQVTDERLRNASSQAKDLEFPAEPSKLSFFGTPRMAIYKPEGAGPLPAIVLFHQCGGLASASGKWQNLSMLNWAKEAVKRGYVAFLVDGFSQRDVDSTCFGPKNGVNLMRNTRDALQAAAYLRTFGFVDKQRVALVGFSHGAMIGILASSRQWARVLGPGEPFAAVVSFYPGCFTIKPPTGSPYEIINSDIDRPLLVLMGDKDNETPPQDCVARLEPLKAGGAPVEWHIYPGVTHCWDCENKDGDSKVDARGNRVVYYYDKQATLDSARRMFDFSQERMR